MAGTGYTFVQAINEIVEVVGEFPMTGSIKPSALGTPDTTSNYARAEQFVDRYNKRIQAQGWPENTTFSKKYTSADAGGSAFQVSFGGDSNVLRVKSAGSSSHRDLVLRVDGADGDRMKVYDANQDSFTLAAVAEDIFLDVVVQLDFEDLTAHLQDVIIGQAKMAYQRRLQGNLNMDQALSHEYMQSEAQAPRNAPDIEQPFNVRPMIPGSGGGQQKSEK
jgi:hypothetical protein